MSHGGGCAAVGERSTFTLTGSILRSNKADRGGAVAALGTVAFDGCAVEENAAAGAGGGLLFAAAAASDVVRLVDTTVAGNSADSGAGVCVLDGRLVLEGATRFEANAARNSRSAVAAGGDDLGGA